MGKETARSLEKRREGDMKLTNGSWRALFYITSTQVLYFAALGDFFGLQNIKLDKIYIITSCWSKVFFASNVLRSS